MNLLKKKKKGNRKTLSSRSCPFQSLQDIQTILSHYATNLPRKNKNSEELFKLIAFIEHRNLRNITKFYELHQTETPTEEKECCHRKNGGATI